MGIGNVSEYQVSRKHRRIKDYRRLKNGFLYFFVAVKNLFLVFKEPFGGSFLYSCIKLFRSIGVLKNLQ
jgi:hypothetical protein